MVVLLTQAAVSSPNVKRNIEYALGAKNYSNRLIPVVVGNLDRFPAAEVPWIVRRMPWFELDRRQRQRHPDPPMRRHQQPLRRLLGTSRQPVMALNLTNLTYTQLSCAHCVDILF